MHTLASVAAFYLTPQWFGRSVELSAEPVRPVLVRLAVAGALLALLLALPGFAASP
jgi:hypothetical protein